MSHGTHVKVVGKGASALLADALAVEGFLREAVGALGMRMLGGPHVYDVPLEVQKMGAEPFEDEGGVTAVCVLSTSHAAIHTWPLRHAFVADFFSCRPFDPNVVEALLRRRLGGFGMRVSDLSFALEPADD